MKLNIYILFGFLFISSYVYGQTDQMQYTSYYFNDSGNNTVITSSFNLAKKILSRTFLLLDIELDNVTVPPIDGTTGASRPQRRSSEPFEKTRGQVIVGLEQGLGPTTTKKEMAVNLYRSQEVDYLSNSLIATFSQDLFQRNTTITLRGQVNDDRVGKINTAGDITKQSKRVYTAAAQLTQLLSKTTVLNLYYDAVYMDGYLSDPYRQVKVFDTQGVSTITDELHPDTRLRHAGTIRLNQFIVPFEASLIASYRYYLDDWDVTSNTIELKLNKYIFKDLVFGSSYRYYTQSDAKFIRDRYVGDSYLANAYRSDDYKLKKFYSNNFGFSLEYLLRGIGRSNPDFEFLRNSSIEFMYFRYVNELNFSANIIQGSLKFKI